jgi:tRNA-2-methylthio-N6-dimethylallyladenosine synthase
MKYYLATFGCQMNISDSERIASVLESAGYKPTSKITEADLIVANMCSVRQSAVDRVYGLANNIEKLNLRKKGVKTVLAGCILGKDKKKLANGFDFVLDIRTLASIATHKHK